MSKWYDASGYPLADNSATCIGCDMVFNRVRGFSDGEKFMCGKCWTLAHKKKPTFVKALTPEQVKSGAFEMLADVEKL